MAGTKLPKGRGTARISIRPFRDDELRNTLEAARGKSDLYADIVELLSLTGLRWGEMVALTAGCVVQVPQPALIVERSKSDGYEEKVTKSGQGRRVPLVARAVELIDKHTRGKGADEPVFRSARGAGLSGPNFTRSLDWKSIAHGHRIHDLRHTAATNWLTNGVDINTVAAWLGHSDSSVTLRIYTHYVPNHSDIAAVERLEAAAAAKAEQQVETAPIRRIG